eukprot:scaffold10472_cov126-Cylindrotheca_fusiformis.AAC.10
MGRRRFYQDLESGDFQVSFDVCNYWNNNGDLDHREMEEAYVDDQVSKLSDPQSSPSPDRPPRLDTRSPTRSFSIKRPLKFIRNKVIKKNQTHNRYDQRNPSEESNLLGLLPDTEEEEEEPVLPSPHFFLSTSHGEAGDCEDIVFEDSPRSGILTRISSCASSSHSNSSGIPGTPNINAPCDSRGTYAYFFLGSYLLVGAFILHSCLANEDDVSWTYIDSAYACLRIVATIGYPLEMQTSGQEIFWTVYCVIGSSCVLVLALFYVMKKVLETESVKKQHCQETILRALDGESAVPSRYCWNCSNGLVRVLAALCLPFVIAKTSGWTVGEMIHFSVFTAYTIGHSEVALTTQPAKILAILWIPLAVGCVLQALTGIACHLYSSVIQRSQVTADQLGYTLQELDLELPKGRAMSRAEFLEMTLISMDRIDPLLILELRRKFDALKDRGDGQGVSRCLVESRQRFGS